MFLHINMNIIGMYIFVLSNYERFFVSSESTKSIIFKFFVSLIQDYQCCHYCHLQFRDQFQIHHCCHLQFHNILLVVLLEYEQIVPDILTCIPSNQNLNLTTKLLYIPNTTNTQMNLVFLLFLG